MGSHVDSLTWNGGDRFYLRTSTRRAFSSCPAGEGPQRRPTARLHADVARLPLQPRRTPLPSRPRRALLPSHPRRTPLPSQPRCTRPTIPHCRVPCDPPTTTHCRVACAARVAGRYVTMSVYVRILDRINLCCISADFSRIHREKSALLHSLRKRGGRQREWSGRKGGGVGVVGGAGEGDRQEERETGRVE